MDTNNGIIKNNRSLLNSDHILGTVQRDPYISTWTFATIAVALFSMIYNRKYQVDDSIPGFSDPRPKYEIIYLLSEEWGICVSVIMHVYK